MTEPAAHKAFVPANLDRVLVTGATGLLGLHMVRGLLEAGVTTRAFVRNPEKARQLFGAHANAIEIAVGDITDKASIATALQGCDGLVHSAAMVALDSAQDPEALLRVNLGGTRNAIDAAVNAGLKRIVHVSSTSILYRRDGSPVTEQSSPQPSQGAYARSKTQAEAYVRDLQAQGLPVQVIYPGSILAPEDPGNNAAMEALDTFANRFLPLTTGGLQFVDARDVANVMLCMLRDTPAPNRVLVPGIFVPWAELAVILKKVLGRRPPAFPVPGAFLRALGKTGDWISAVTPFQFILSYEGAIYATQWFEMKNSDDLKRFGMRFRPIEGSIGDALQWLQREAATP